MTDEVAPTGEEEVVEDLDESEPIDHLTEFLSVGQPIRDGSIVV